MKRIQGLNKDVHPEDQPEGTYRDARNITILQDIQAVVNEEGTSGYSSIPENYTVIGHQVISNNRIVVFCVTESSSEIGVINSKGQYSTILNDPDLNFNKNYLIDSTYKLESVIEESQQVDPDDYEFPEYSDSGDVPDAPEITNPEDGSSDNSLPITFKWTEVSNASQYRLQVSESSDFVQSDIVVDQTLSGLTYIVEELDYDNFFHCRVRAENIVGSGDWSSTVSFYVREPDLQVPEITSISETEDGSFIINWTTEEGDVFELQREDQDTADGWVHVVEDELSGYEDDLIDFQIDEEYCYRVRAKQGDIVSDWSQVECRIFAGEGEDVPDEGVYPLDLNITLHPLPDGDECNGTLTMVWSNPEGENITSDWSVQLQLYEDGEPYTENGDEQYFTVFDASNNTSYEFNEACGGITYTFRARYVIDQPGEWSPLSNEDGLTTPDISEFIANSLGIEEVELQWSLTQDSDDADKYEVYRDGTFIDETQDLNFIDSGLSSSTQYEYFIKAINAAGETQSEIQTVTTDSSDISLDCTSGSNPKSEILLTWDDPGLDSFNIYRKQAGGSFEQIVSGTTSTSYTDTGLDQGTEYIYYIEGILDGNVESESNECSHTTEVDEPQDFDCSPGEEEITLTWTGQEGVRYDLEVEDQDNTDVWHELLSNANLSGYTHNNLDHNNTYNYRLRSRVDDVVSDWVTTSCSPDEAIPDAPEEVPENLSASVNYPIADDCDGEVEFSWSNPSGTSEWNIEVEAIKNGSPVDNIVTLDPNTVTYIYGDSSGEEVCEGDKIEFRVRYTNISGAGDWATYEEGEEFILPSDVEPSCEAMSDTAISVEWSATIADTYELYRHAQLIFTTDSSTSYFDTGLTPGTEYSYYVIAYNEYGETQSSSTICMTDFEDIELGCTPQFEAILLSWNDVIPNQVGWEYELQRRESGVSDDWQSFFMDPDQTSLVDEVDGWEFGGMDVNKDYDYRVRGYNSYGLDPTDWSNITTCSASEEPDSPPSDTEVPSNLDIEIDELPGSGNCDGSIDLTWSNNYESTEWQVRLEYENSETVDLPAGANSTTRYDICADEEYGFRARYFNDEGTGPWSDWYYETIGAKTPDPEDLYVSCSTAGNTAIEVNWVDIEADSYSIYKDGSFAGNTLNNSFYVSGLEPGRNYEFYVEAIFDNDDNVVSETTSCTTDSDTFSLSATAQSVDSVELDWENQYVDEYRVYRNGNLIKTITDGSTSYLDDGIQPGTEYEYYIELDTQDSGTLQSTTESEFTEISTPELSCEGREGEIRLNWTHTGITYDIYRDVPDTPDDFELIKEDHVGTSYDDTDLQPDVTRCYRVVAKGEDTESSQSNTSCCTPEEGDGASSPPSEVPDELSIAPSHPITICDGKIEFTWNNTTDEWGIDLEYFINNTSQGIYGLESGTVSYEVDGVCEGDTYYFRVRYYNSQGNGSWAESDELDT